MKTTQTISLIAVASLFSMVALAQDPNLRLPISLDADELEYDGKSSMHIYRGLRVSQGNLGVIADEARASNLDFEDSVWEFYGNVVIDVPNGRIECDSAHVKFADHQLQRATIVGSPATFRMQRRDSDEVTYGEAGRLEYDFESSIVEFSDEAMLTEGGNRITSNYLVYNIEEQRINARSAGEGEPKVKITYTPRDSDEPEDDDDPTPQAGDDTDDRDNEQ
jgi:lipopolysaccharide export system protein LptA